MNADENFKVRSAAKLCEVYFKLNIIIDLLIKKGIMSKEEGANMLGELSKEECKNFINNLFSIID
jgi:polyhydroxyalkanoate synthesis regulator phasin